MVIPLDICFYNCNNISNSEITQNSIAAILIVVPSYRMEKKWDPLFIEALKETANEISARLHSSRKIE